ncbi:flagellar biosynthetic protein FliQ [Stakelama pacifica]|uniref:Flagellar biosynthetic protein FliQ n=1 Tax=Stakelama pacifica TaxID=517720 RepID=A0A4R6FI74_9SPHN|nr:flagellar biosynthetic protein FliQ [Stakelama pacifica]TDN81129.1 flagellar biosynthetic protein FliQ [Stakelama pacifica]GGO96841.1 flagellar biosynthesis protein FliQ [Stakelama pacifica]
MEAATAIELARAALVLTLTVAGPMLFGALITGVVIGLMQALTQIQEQTLTFVPKILVMGTVLLLSLPMIGSALGQFMTLVSDHIISGR